jgi:hypothetical protein
VAELNGPRKTSVNAFLPASFELTWRNSLGVAAFRRNCIERSKIER